MVTEIKECLEQLREELPTSIKLVAVSKFHPVEVVRAAYDAGQRLFGESRVQEMVAKHDALPKDIEWHFIGHLQPNKVKYIAPFVHLIHAVDSLKLLAEIDKQARRCDRVIPCLLQLHVAAEETKFGFSVEECEALLSSGEWRSLHHVSIVGLMCMATNTDDQERIRHDFHEAYMFYKHAKKEYFAQSPEFCIRSWGMSHDFPLAVTEGATMVRVGTRIFGNREY